MQNIIDADFIGDGESLAASKRVAERFMVGPVAKFAAEKLILTLKDDQVHSASSLVDGVAIHIQTYPKSFSDSYPEMQGTVFRRLMMPLFDFRHHAGVAMFDYFVTATEDDETPPLISLAVSFFPREASKLPADLHSVLVHATMLSQEEFEALNKIYKR